MAPGEKSDIVQVLEDSRTAFNEAAGGLSEAQAAASPAEGRWSVRQCVEHVTVAEERFLGWLENAGRSESPCLDANKESEIFSSVTNRTRRAEAPEPVRPSGRYASLADALAAFNAIRARTVAFAIQRAAELHTLACQHPRFGPVNGRELLAIIAGHANRHAEQIRETRAAV